MLQENHKPDFFHVESMVEEVIERLNAELGDKWHVPEVFAIHLSVKVAEIIGEDNLRNGWRFWVEEPIRDIGAPMQDILNMTLSTFLGKQDLSGPGSHLYWLNSAYINQCGDTLVGDLVPDLVISAPNNEMWVWDLTSTYTDDHMSKMILFSDIISNENQLCHIGETIAHSLEGK